MKNSKRIFSVVLCVLIAVGSLSFTASAKAKKFAKSIKVASKASITIPAAKKSVTKSYKVTVKVSGKAIKKFTAKSSKASVASVKVSGSNIKVTAKKSGKTTITVTTKAKSKKGKKLSAKMVVTVKKASAPKTTPKPSTEPKDDPVVDPINDPVVDPEPAPRGLEIDTKVGTVSRKASSGKDPITGEESVVDIDVNQSKTVFSDVPVTAVELKSLHKADEILEDKQDAALETDKANGRFEVVALYFAALKAYDPKNPDVAFNMMEELCESPTTKIRGVDSFNNFSKQAMKDNLNKSYKYKYMGNAYFDGAEPSNGYTPTTPLTVTLEDYVYSSEKSNDYQTWIYKITVRFPGADSERIIQVYQDTIDGKWYIFSDSWKGFTADIKEPALKYQALWQQEG